MFKLWDGYTFEFVDEDEAGDDILKYFDELNVILKSNDKFENFEIEIDEYFFVNDFEENLIEKVK